MKDPEDEGRCQQNHEEALQHSFSEFAQLKNQVRRMYNVQTRTVLGRITGFPRRFGDPDVRSEEELFIRSKGVMDTFAFVGITEHFVESLQLLCYTFGWPIVEEAHK